LSLAPGTRLGPYQIEAAIGAGGMGEVYKARDTRLNRTVAIKVLPAELNTDPELRARFEREARAVAALSHPHICTLHDIGTHDGTTYLVMEYLAGESLAERLLHGPLPLAQALDIGAQIAEALHAAHKHGIIHRDLKPGNVMLTSAGAGRSGVAVAKLLDFGLAKLAGHGAEPAAAQLASVATRSAPLTTEGSIVGTLQYMAPEQVEGKPVDARTDLWALGAILYEMVTGKRPFEGTSAASLIGAILEREPAPIASLQPLTPPSLDRLVKKCLAKHPDDRWDGAHDLADELHWMRESSGLVERTAASGSSDRRRWKFTAAVILAAVCLAAVGLAIWTRGSPQQTTAPTPGPFRFVQLTDQPGRECFPSLSPDGKSVVYASHTMGNWDIHLQRVGGRNPINLTRDSQADESEAAFSPNGEWIAFRSERDGGGIFIMGATGESVRRLTDAGHNPAWSPDGSEIAYATEGVSGPESRWAMSEIWAVAVLSGVRRLVSPGDGVQPQWSPHGQRIAYWQYKGGQRDLATVPARGGAAREVTNDTAMDWSPAWSPDGRYLYFSSNRGGSMNLWRVPIEEPSGRLLGAFEPVTTPSLYSGNLSFSRDGTLLAYADRVSGHTLRSVGFDATTGRSVGQPSPTPGPAAAYDPSPSQDGNWLAFVSGRNQNDIFVVRTDGTDLRQLTDDSYQDLGPRWSPDGERVLFFSNRSGRYQVWSINADGSGHRQVTEAADEMWYPVWSPDGRRVAAFDSGARNTSVFDASVPWNEQSPQLLPALNETGGRFQVWSWSPDGRLLVGTELMPDGRRQGVLVYSFEDRRFRTLTGVGGFAVWLRDSRRLVFSAGDKLNLVDSQSREVKEVLSLAPHAPGPYFSISADNRTLYFSVFEDEGNIWLASLK